MKTSGSEIMQLKVFHSFSGIFIFYFSMYFSSFSMSLRQHWSYSGELFFILNWPCLIGCIKPWVLSGKCINLYSLLQLGPIRSREHPSLGKAQGKELRVCSACLWVCLWQADVQSWWCPRFLNSLQFLSILFWIAPSRCPLGPGFPTRTQTGGFRALCSGSYDRRWRAWWWRALSRWQSPFWWNRIPWRAPTLY